MAASSDVPTKARPYRPPDPSAGDEVPCLVVLTGSRAGDVIALSAGTSVVGRDPSAKISLQDDGVSRNHARIIVTREGIISLTDLGSTNGTFVNGARQHSAALREGDRIQVGPDVTIKLTLRGRGEVEPRRAAPVEIPLSDRELEVARMVADGLRNAEIGERLSISPRTVGTHLRNIYERLSLHSRAALTRWVLETCPPGS